MIEVTGPGLGKFVLEGSRVFVLNAGRELEVDATVYIHMKGYSFARVTHLDIEHEALNEWIDPNKGGFYSIYGIEEGLRIKVVEESAIEIHHSLLNQVMRLGEKTRTWVGGKEGGIYIGFKKREIEKLEDVLKKEFGEQVENLQRFRQRKTA